MRGGYYQYASPSPCFVPFRVFFFLPLHPSGSPDCDAAVVGREGEDEELGFRRRGSELREVATPGWKFSFSLILSLYDWTWERRHGSLLVTGEENHLIGPEDLLSAPYLRHVRYPPERSVGETAASEPPAPLCISVQG